jgi:twitching motility two-component system response regulator PilH
MNRRATVLIVEDDDGQRQVYRVALAMAGFDVQEAANGIEALQSIDRHPPDAVLLDIHLPVFGGVFVREQLAAQPHTKDIPVVVVTGLPGDFSGLGVAHVLKKPVSPDELVAAVRQSLSVH